jgi:hypothetical protein
VIFDRLSRWEAIGASVEGKKELVDLMAWAAKKFDLSINVCAARPG